MSFRRSAATVLCSSLLLSSWPAGAVSRKAPPAPPAPLSVPFVVTVPAVLPELPAAAAAVPEAASITGPVATPATDPVKGTGPAIAAAPMAAVGANATPEALRLVAPAQAASAAVPAEAAEVLLRAMAGEAPLAAAPAADALDASAPGRAFDGSAARPAAEPVAAAPAGSGPRGPKLAPSAPGRRGPVGWRAAAAYARATGYLLAAASLPTLGLFADLADKGAAALGVMGFAAGAAAASVVGRELIGTRFQDNARAHFAGLSLAMIVGGAAVAASTALLAAWSPVAASAALAASIAGLAAHSGRLEPLADLLRGRRGPAPLFKVSRGMGGQYLSLERGQLGKLYLLSGVIQRGTGEKGLSHPVPFVDKLVLFRRAGDALELVEVHPDYRAAPGTPMALTLERSLPETVVARTRIVSEDRLTGRLTVSLDGLVAQDLYGLSDLLEESYGAPYRLDPDSGAQDEARGFPKNLELGARYSFLREGPTVWADQDTPGLTDTHLLDLRRIEVSMRYSLIELPPAGYEPRPADDRVGYFTTTFDDWSDDQKDDLKTNLIQRWRLEKQDPAAPLSPPKTPIIFWMDPSVPAEYREAVRRGALAWNPLFEKAGFKDAVVVKDPEPGSDYDPDDARFSVIRYYIERDSGFAFGMWRSDPRTGEILKATVALSAKHMRKPLGQDFKDIDQLDENDVEKPARRGHDPRRCGHAAHRAQELSMNLALLEARGGMTEAQRRRFLEEYMTDLVLHEVGHVLGLRHNFLGKSWHTPAELETAPQMTASVMDYYPVHIAAPGRRQGPYNSTEPGPYDAWAIEYGYRPLDGRTAAEKAAALRAIASRSQEPGLAYLTDEDLTDLDPRTAKWTLGSDILDWTGGRMDLVRELWGILTAKAKGTGEGDGGLYKSFVQGWLAYLKATRAAVKHVGGMHFHRRGPGSPAALPSFEPVPAETQRRALDLIARRVFSDSAFDLDPELMKRLAPIRRSERGESGEDLAYLPWEELVLKIRDEAVLEYLLSNDLFSKLRESRRLRRPDEDHLGIEELFSILSQSIFSEAYAPKGTGRSRKKRTVSPMRRQLQEAYVDRMLDIAYPARHEDEFEASSLARAHLRGLLGRLNAGLKVAGWEAASRTHLKETAKRLSLAAEKYEP